MVRSNRTKISVYNTSVTLGIYGIRLLLQFVNRNIFLHFLGVYYLGLSGVFTNVLGILSLAELGIGASIIYALYKPVSDENWGKAKAYLLLYRKIYRRVAAAILGLGLLMFPFLPQILQIEALTTDLVMIYGLFLVNSVISYLTYGYKRSLLQAYQKNYLLSLLDFSIYVMSLVCQWVILYYTQNYHYFLGTTIASTILSNVAISYLVDKTFPQIHHVDLIAVTAAEKTALKKNVLGNFLGNVAAKAVFSTDNILLSSFVSVASVGLYSNYTIVTGALTNLLSQLLSSNTALVGNMIHRKVSEELYDLFVTIQFLNFILSFILSTLIALLLPPFISLWLGERFLMAPSISLLLAVYVFLETYRYTGFMFYSTYGLYWQSRYKPIAEALINLGLSLLFLQVFNLGLEGILLGTIGSTLLTNAWFEPYVIFKYGLKRSVRSYAMMKLWHFCLFGFMIFGIVVNSAYFISPKNWIGLISQGVLYALGLLGILVICYGRTREGALLFKLLKGLIKKGRNKHATES
ncbi:transporter [Streptococcus suis]|uniref:lipopolysaccharide biosynthesis protein n=1 Tax=Streptococcus suis TaxID=1307 RepID=UPI001ABDAC32|nr:transporter [Streptococcus suis]MBO4127286.1 transporter [Streptococcus suis]WFA75458.1 transporter [Streptococcus suis]